MCSKRIFGYLFLPEGKRRTGERERKERRKPQDDIIVVSTFCGLPSLAARQHQQGQEEDFRCHKRSFYAQTLWKRAKRVKPFRRKEKGEGAPEVQEGYGGGYETGC